MRYWISGLIALTVVVGTAVESQAAFITTTNRGTISQFGARGAATNYVVGQLNLGTPTLFRNYFAFNLAAITETITSASLTAFNPAPSGTNGAGYVGDGSRTYSLYDVTTSLNGLTNPFVNGVPAYNDLGTGAVFGTATVSATNNGQFVNVTLNADGLAALNAARIQNGGNGLFSIGGALTPITGSENQYLFGQTSPAFPAVGNAADGNTGLTFQTGQVGSVVATPAPPAAIVAVLGAAGLGFFRRRFA